MKRISKGILTILLILAMSVTMLVPAAAANLTESETKATALKQLGLFKGVSDTNFDLGRAPTRTEAMVMLIRVLGKESEALNGTFAHPFTDVASWADQYVGYAYQNGLTKGVSATEFGSGNANSDMYLTFVLRALGYDDAAGDFAWDAPDALAQTAGILPNGVDTAALLRADVVLVSWAALGADLKGGSQTLAEKLISAHSFTTNLYVGAQNLVSGKAAKVVSVSSAAALETALSDSAVTAITIDSIGTPVVVTGQLTIPAGVTVTVNRGNDFYIEGTLTNNGAIYVMGADSIDLAAEFINYSVLSVQNGGKLVNTGDIKLLASVLTDTSDNGPVGGQFRVLQGGTIDNSGTVTMEAGVVNTHGGAAVVEEGTFNNDGIVTVSGFFLRIIKGAFINNSGASLTNNSYVSVEAGGTFTNNGTFSGGAIIY